MCGSVSKRLLLNKLRIFQLKICIFFIHSNSQWLLPVFVQHCKCNEIDEIIVMKLLSKTQTIKWNRFDLDSRFPFWETTFNPNSLILTQNTTTAAKSQSQKLIFTSFFLWIQHSRNNFVCFIQKSWRSLKQKSKNEINPKNHSHISVSSEFICIHRRAFKIDFSTSKVNRLKQVHLSKSPDLSDSTNVHLIQF